MALKSAFLPATEYERYDAVPTFRKRWVFVLAVLFFIPAAIVIAATGDIYALVKGKVVRFPPQQKTIMIVAYSFFLVFNLLRVM